MYNFHYVAGLKELGYDVHYIERVNAADECYDPVFNAFADDVSYGMRFLRHSMDSMEFIATPWTLIDRAGRCHGSTRDEMCTALDRAEFVLTLADPTWFEDLERCPRRAFLDGDPLFTQVRMLVPDSPTAIALANYPTLFTYWTRQNSPDTTVPAAGRAWISTTPVVATALWEAAAPRPNVPVTTIMNWSGFNDVTFGGRTYGKKDVEFERMIDLPSLTSHTFAIGVGGDTAPRERLRAHGWMLENPLIATGTISAYREFIANSYADFGIAKHAYVASRSGWFSDRSLCYLASGRPVLHQDTGFTDWLPTGEGVVAFSTVEEAAAGLRCLDDDYPRHVKAARGIAETHFEARKVIGQMLDDAGLR